MITIANVDVEFLTFPAGETFFKIKNDLHKLDAIIIDWKYENDSEIFQIYNLLDYVSHKHCQTIIINAPYLPHARQDRYTGVGQPFSLKVLIEGIIKFSGKNKVIINTLDVHSEVGKRLCEETLSRVILINSYPRNIRTGYDYYVAPDAGSILRVEVLAPDKNKILRCEKTRDPNTGRLSAPKIPDVDLKGKNLLIIDDICDGGGTFEMLAQELKRHGAKTVDLFVSHCIMSKGRNAMPSVDSIFYANNMRRNP